MNVKSMIKNIVNGVAASNSIFNRRYPPGHFYSPIPNLQNSVEYRENLPALKNVDSLGIDLKLEKQLCLMETLSECLADFDFAENQANRGDYRYWKNNGFFPDGDAAILFSLLKLVRPERIVEIGSGFSSALMLDMVDAGCLASDALHFVEPNPERLKSLLKQNDRQKASVIEKKIQDVSLSDLPALGSGDVLFVDSSHVASIGSDLCHILFNLVPTIASGCYVHFHDICWPFEYPREYLLAGRAWNEIYLLRAFLQFNDSFEVVFWGSHLKSTNADLVAKTMPQLSRSPSSSIWLRRK